MNPIDTENKIMTEKESLEVITRMIQNTQQQFGRYAGMPFVIWGYSTLLISVLVWLLLTLTFNPCWHLLWPAIVPLGILGTFLSPKNSENYVATYTDKVVGHIWLVIGVCAVLASLFSWFRSLNVLFVEALLINIGVAVTGLSIRLKYIAVMGFIEILVAFTLLFFTESINRIWIFALLVITTMIIPGHIMNRQGRKYNTQPS